VWPVAYSWTVLFYFDENRWIYVICYFVYRSNCFTTVIGYELWQRYFISFLSYDKHILWVYFCCYILTASVGKSAGGSKMVSASVMEADNMFQGFSYVPPAEDAFS
jgi:hypothetical protein